MTPAPASSRRTTFRVAALVAAQLVAMAGPASGALAGGPDTSALVVVAFAAAFVTAGLVPLKLELGRHTFTVTVTESVLVVAVFHLDPLSLVLSVAVAEALICLRERISLLKSLFNVTSAACSATVATAIVAAAGGVAAEGPGAWLVALLAVGGFSAWSLTSTTAAIAATEQRPARVVLLQAAPTFVVTVVSSASLGLAGHILFAANPAAPVLLVPLVAAGIVEHRRRAEQQAERLRFERLYAASSNSSTLACFEEAQASLATAARTLVTGATAVCCAVDPDGTWSGMVVGDHGARRADPDAVRALVASTDHGGGSRSVSGLPAEVRRLLPTAVDIVVAASAPGSAVPVVLAVLRESPADGQSRRRSDVLAAFAGHAALTIANVQLYESVEAALRHQVDLNRQKAEFIAAVSHELRTPLTAALGAVQTVRRLEGRLQPEQRDELLDSALSQGDRLRRLIEDLLLVAAAEHRSMRCDVTSIDLARLLADVTAAFDHPCEPTSGEHRVRVTRSVDVVASDDAKLHRILANLVENAAKYAPAGPIEIDVGPDAGDMVVFSVADRGPGIAPDDRERVFERFVQLDQSSTRTRGGTGLGLYLCRQLAELLGGSLTVEGRDGGGARFVLRLPVAGPANADSRAAPGAGPRCARPGRDELNRRKERTTR